MYIYLVWEQYTTCSNKVLLDIFETQEGAEKFAYKYEDEYYALCCIETKEVNK